MKIDLKKFLGLTGLMAAPLMTAPLSGCVIVADDEEESATASDTANNTSGATDGGTSAGTDGGTSAGTDGGTTGTGGADSTGAATEGETSPTGTDSGTDSGTAGTSTDTDGATPPCCEATFELGCAEDPAIEKCVCAQDALCCDEGWDDICVSEIAQFNCGEACPVIDPTGE